MMKPLGKMKVYNADGSKNSVCFDTSRAGSENSDSGEASTRVRSLHQATAAQHRDVAQYDRGSKYLFSRRFYDIIINASSIKSLFRHTKLK